MKLNNFLITCLATLAMFSCSDNDIIDDGKEPTIIYDATLSLAVNDNKITKADEEAPYPGTLDFIGRLSVAVFQGDKLVAFADSSNADKGVYGIKELNVPSGNAKVLVLANTVVPDDLKAVGTATLDNYQNFKINLDKEITGQLTMSSGVIDCSIRAGHNYMGYGKTGSMDVDHNGSMISGVGLIAKPIEMIRNIAWIQLYQLKVNVKDPEYGFGYGKISFTLKKIYLRNVKNKSLALLTSSKSTEDNQSLMWNGVEQNFLAYDWTNAPKNKEQYNKCYFFLNNMWDFFLDFNSDWPGVKPVVIENNSTSIPGGDNGQGAGGGLPHGSQFYVYENTDTSDDNKNLTALIVEGDYSYYPNQYAQSPTVIENTCYTVLVNDLGKSAIYENGESSINKDPIGYDDVEKYVRHNQKYIINLTIAGPGGKKPYDAHVAAEVRVEDWNVIKQSGNVD